MIMESGMMPYNTRNTVVVENGAFSWDANKFAGEENKVSLLTLGT
jgi:hypothetical protein